MDSEHTQQEAKRHVKDISNYEPTRLIVGDEGQWLILKKTEKLTTAIYLVTDFLNEKELTKWELRSKALALLSFITSSLNNSQQTLESAAFVRQVEKMIGELLLFLELALRVSLISTMNFSVLKGEYVLLNEHLHIYFKRKGPMQDVSFPDNLFGKEEVMPIFGKLTPTKFPSEHKGHDKRQDIDKRQDSGDMSYTSGSPLLIRKNKSERGELVLRLIKTKGEVSIKDIASVISDCSEKTIQRELSSLIFRGILERRGERRWSTYILKREHAESRPDTNLSSSLDNLPAKT